MHDFEDYHKILLLFDYYFKGFSYKFKINYQRKFSLYFDDDISGDAQYFISEIFLDVDVN